MSWDNRSKSSSTWNNRSDDSSTWSNRVKTAIGSGDKLLLDDGLSNLLLDDGSSLLLGRGGIQWEKR